MKTLKVKSLAHLKELIEQGHTDYHISLGLCRSSKFINMEDDTHFFILNLIDDSEQVLSEEEMMNPDCTNIGKAMTEGHLYCEL